MLSKGWIKKLFKEISTWVEEGIIEPNQADKIKDRYSRQLEYNRLVSSIFILGSILIGAGIILFIASNWQHLGKLVKIGLVFSFVLGFNLLGYHFRFEKSNHPKLGEPLLFLGAISFGAGIWLIAQIFQIPYNYANGFLFWIIGILPVIFLLYGISKFPLTLYPLPEGRGRGEGANLLRSKSVLVLTSLLLPVWLSVFIANNLSNPVYPFFLLLAIIIYLVYRERQKASLFISIIGVSIWLTHYLYLQQPAITDYFSINMQLLYGNLFIAYGFILYFLGMLHRRGKFGGFSIIYKALAMLFIFINNYSLTFAHHYAELFHPGKAQEVVYLPLAFLIIYALYLLSGIIISKHLFKSRNSEEKKEAGIIFPFLILQIILMHFGPLGENFVSISYNILFFAEIIAFLYLGYLLRQESIFKLSLGAFALNTLTRYFDTFWKIFPRSIFFIIGGLILIFGGMYMEKKRKSVEKSMKEKLAEERG